MLTENFKEQLALSVRSIQWSYAIFWSTSSTQPGRVLSWGEGYYNGDIKTRKTSQGVELNSDQIGLQRSEQLRELYKSLKTVEASPQTKRPSAALSPEDLTDTEWYYLVCMSFVFNIGQGLPGKALAKGEPIWLCDAPSSDCRDFSRCLLAKSASIQTVVCFPFMDGVIELGTTDYVSEDLSLIQQIRTSFLDILDVGVHNVHGAFNAKQSQEVGGALISITSPNNSSNAFQANQPPDETFMVERINNGTSQVQSWQIMDDELSNAVHNSSDCVSQTLHSPENVASLPKGENLTDSAKDLQKCNNSKMTLVDPRSDDWHYQMVLSTLLKSSDQLIMGMHFQNFHQESSFTSWKKAGSVSYQRPRTGGSSQALLKKVLFEVPRMHLDGILEYQEENDFKEAVRTEADENGMNHVLSERRRRAKLNERFLTLRSMVPSITKDDKVSILDDAIEYLRKLEKRIKELEAHKDLTDREARTKRSPQDMVERTSDNYFTKTDNGNKSMAKKRKSRDIDDTRPEINSESLLKGSSTNDVAVNINENNEVVIEMKCPSRAGMFLKIMEAVSSLRLNFHSVQSSEVDGNLYFTLKSKLTGPTIVSAKRIKQTLQNVAFKC
ncbi:transcription factor GLABRA 3 isoform X1 [Arachis stenosperma]|uniref:transcription factor GLABRA 3 isoform X1 n=1 Tax=Arachis stenosperma TaxID=217475 RepID=UPI0025AD6DF7|nr:transcription factor GLABRA 3 isoform X1 [Arachis stenosperma]XP_057752019.1 transcription factor GLABRA 3 isoform X1 [Arachis stenosperma]